MSTFAWGGRSWGANDIAAFKQWLAKHGASYATWARRHPGAAATFKSSPARTTLSYADVAAQRANEAIAPELTALEGEREQARDYYNRLLQQQAGVSEAAARLVGGIAPVVGQAYGDAGDAVASYGRGFGDIQNQIQGAEKSALAGVLEKSGASPEQVAQVNAKVGSEAAGDVVYGVGGYIPAVDLRSQGAAAQTFAAGLPADALAQGEQSRRESISQMLENDMKLLTQISAARAKIPGLQNEFLQQLLENRRADEALNIQKDYLGIAGRKTDAELTGIDPVTGLPTPDTLAEVADTAKEKATARSAAVKAREDEFVSARQSLFEDAKGLGEKTKVTDPTRPWAPATEQVVKPDYATAKKALFDQYKYLLRYANRSGQAALKRRLNKMIDEALSAAGIKPPPKKSTVRRRPDLGKPKGG